MKKLTTSLLGVTVLLLSVNSAMGAQIAQTSNADLITENAMLAEAGAQDDVFILYPNPTEGTLYLEMFNDDWFEYYFVDSNGDVMGKDDDDDDDKKKKKKGRGIHIITDLAHGVDNGTYYFHLVQGDNHYVTTVIKGSDY